MMRAPAFGLVACLAMLVPAVPAGATQPIPAGGTLINVPVRTLTEMRFSNIVPQTYDVSCGAAAVATLFTYYYGEEVSERQAIESMLEIGDKEKIEEYGFSLLELKRYAERRGYVSAGYRVKDVDKLANLKVPAITLITTRGYTHFVVIKGVKAGEVYIADPAFGNRARPLDEFAEGWENVILVVLSEAKDGNNKFTLDGTVQARLGDIIPILDSGLRSIAPLPGEF